MQPTRIKFANISTTFPESRDKLMLVGELNASGVYRPCEIVDPYLNGEAEVASTIGVVEHYVTALATAIVQRRVAA